MATRRPQRLAPLPSVARLKATARGRAGELSAAVLLTLKGYRILTRRWRSSAGEIDIIARRGRTLVFVEVKTRAAETAALDAVAPRQRRRILAAAELFRAERPRHADCDVRFDLILIAPGRWPQHLPGALNP